MFEWHASFLKCWPEASGLKHKNCFVIFLDVLFLSFHSIENAQKQVNKNRWRPPLRCVPHTLTNMSLYFQTVSPGKHTSQLDDSSGVPQGSVPGLITWLNSKHVLRTCNFVLLNSDKTDVIVFGPKHLRNSPSVDMATRDGIVLASSATTRNFWSGYVL